VLVQPYLSLDGRCEEAIEFYRKAVDAEVQMMMRFSESPVPASSADAGNKIMHASLKIGETTIMASDGQCTGAPRFQGINLALTVPTVADAQRRFAALAEGGQVQMPLTATFFSPSFGMVADKFGVTWMVMASGASM
jgi:PhnB protein